MSYVPIENFYKGPKDTAPSPQSTLGEKIRSFAHWFGGAALVAPSEAPAYMSEHRRQQPASVAVSQTVEVQQVQ